MDFQSRTYQFTNWLSQSGVHISPKIQIADLRNQSQGRGLIASTNIDQGEVLFKIPRNVLLNIEEGSLSQIGDNKEKLLTKYSHWEGLILTLLYELSLNEDSKWFPYLSILPTEFDCLMYWSDQELSFLRPSLVLDRIGKDKATELYNTLIPNALIDLHIPNLNVSLDLFHRVASTIMSYSFDVERPDFDEDQEDDEVVKFDGYYKSMVCLADILNADTHLSNANLFYEHDFLVMKSIKPIKENEQIYNTYGDHPNSELLRRYGYVEWEQGSKFDFGEISIDTFKKVVQSHYNLPAKFMDRVLSFISQTDVEEIEQDIVLDSYEAFIDGETIPEAEILIQTLSIVGQLANELVGLDDPALIKYINRILKKCYQLIENGSMTENASILWNLTIQARLSEYPSHSFRKSVELPLFRGEPASTNKVKMSEHVLKSEVASLQKGLNSFTNKFKIIEDNKLIRNIVKKRSVNEESNRDSKRQKI